MPQCTGRKAPPPSSASAFERVLRAEVDVAPRGMERADLQHHEIERARAARGSSRYSVVRPVSPLKNTRVPLRADDERRPQRRVAVLQAAPGKVLRRRGGHREPGVRQPCAIPTSRARRCARAARPRPRGARRRRATSRTARRASRVRGSSGSRGGRSGRARRSRGRSAAARAAERAPAGSASGPASRDGDARGPQTGSVSTRQAVDLDQHRRVAEPGGAQPARGRLAPRPRAGSSTAAARAARGARRRRETR